MTFTAPAPETPAPLRMLYVEDNRINAILFEEAMRLQGGIELRVAEDGRDALAQIADWMPDMLVLDAHLPDTDGHALLAVLRRRPGLARTPAWMCSADTGLDDIEQAHASGFAGYWTKPLDLPRIRADIDNVRAALRR